ncbi:MAG: hypothetical protein QG588_125 [Candidatus Poribacteria bacterium]|nr:hypothetical protein [Candidatus Poribacteria bacterium]
METIRSFRLSIWQPAKPVRVLDYAFIGKEKDHSSTFEPDRLQEQIYVWDPGPTDIFVGVDKELSNKFHEMLIDKFAQHLEPGERNITLFSEVISNLKLELEKVSYCSWSTFDQTVEINQGDEIYLPVNTALALLNHLQWIAQIFHHVPGASVIIR